MTGIHVRVRNMRRYHASLAIVSATLACSALVAGLLYATAASAGPQMTPNALGRIASAWASANGEASPQSMRAVSTGRQAALSVIDPGTVVVDSSTQSVYAITVRGHFVGAEAHIPVGAQPPTGSVLSLVVDAQSGQVLDWGLTDTLPDLAKVGAAFDVP